MSTKKTTNINFSARLLMLVDELTESNAALFAQKTGIKQATFHNYTKGRPPSYESLNNICNSWGINLNWLVTGKGEKYISNTTQAIDEDPTIAELLEGARRVLKSGNQVAIDALERNIRYFDLAIETEKRLNAMEKRLNALEQRKECDTLPDINEELLEKKAI